MLTLSLSFLLLRTVQAEKIQLPDKIFYWEYKPFIFFNNETQLLEGILPSIYYSLNKTCLLSSSQTLANYNLINESFSEKSFYKMLEDDNEFKNGDNRIWFPLFIDIIPSKLMAKNLDYDNIVNSPSVGVIVHKNKITLLYKFFQSIKLCCPIAGMAGGFIFLVSTLLWLAECFKNQDFSKCFINGFGTSLWWSVVTMTTVGYGDIVPKSLFGRFISIIWMVIGVLIISGLTGTFSSIMATNSFLDIQNTKVAALNNSIDFLIAKKNYNSSLEAQTTYDDVLRAVENQTTDYGVINIDILLNMDFKKNYQNIALIKIIEAVTPVFIVYGNKTNLYSQSKNTVFKDCKDKHIEIIKKNAQYEFGKIPIIENSSPQVFYESLIQFLIPGILTLCVFFAFVTKDVVQFAFKKKYNKEISFTFFLNSNKIEDKESIDKDIPITLYLNSDEIEDNKFTEKDVSMTAFFNSNKNDNNKSPEKDDFFEEITRIEEHLVKLKTMYKK